MFRKLTLGDLKFGDIFRFESDAAEYMVVEHDTPESHGDHVALCLLNSGLLCAQSPVVGVVLVGRWHGTSDKGAYRNQGED